MITMVGLTVIVALQVGTRMLHISLPWAEELARFFMIWLTFLGCSLALERKSHLSVNFFVNMAPDKIRMVLGVFIHILMILFFGVLVIFGIKLSSLSMATTSSSLQWPMGLVYSVLPLSGVASVVYVIIDLIRFMKTKGGKIA